MTVKHAAGAFAGRHLLNAILGTVRFKVMTHEPHFAITAAGGSIVWVVWHGRLLPLAYYHRGQDAVAMISRSGDGEYIARTVAGWGYDAVRGSSSRGGVAALREIVKLARAGRSPFITADGPRGPRQELKPGVLTIAQLSGLPIIAAAAAATRGWWFHSWDRFLVPKPFSTVYLRYSAPLYVPRSASEADLQEIRLQVEATLNNITSEADADAQS